MISEPFGSLGGVMIILMWNDLGFEDIRDMCAIPLNVVVVENAVVPIGALKNTPRRE